MKVLNCLSGKRHAADSIIANALFDNSIDIFHFFIGNCVCPGCLFIAIVCVENSIICFLLNLLAFFGGETADDRSQSSRNRFKASRYKAEADASNFH